MESRDMTFIPLAVRFVTRTFVAMETPFTWRCNAALVRANVGTAAAGVQIEFETTSTPPLIEMALVALPPLVMVLMYAVPPLMLKTPANPAGLPMDAFDALRASVAADRSQFFKDLSMPFYGFNKPGAKVSEGLRHSFWLQGMLAGYPAAYDCIKAFSETDFTEDLRRFDVPTLILHGDADQIVPIVASALLSTKLAKGSILKVYPGFPHGMCSTQKDVINADLLAFFKGAASVAA